MVVVPVAAVVGVGVEVEERENVRWEGAVVGLSEEEEEEEEVVLVEAGREE